MTSKQIINLYEMISLIKFFSDSEKVSYEIVKHPHTSYIQTHSSSVDYDHRNDYGDDRNDYLYEHRKRRQLVF